MTTTSLVSTTALWGAQRTAIRHLQTDLATLNRELVTGRLADPGLTLGATVTRATTLNIDIRVFESVVAGNAVVGSGISTTLAALDAMADGASDMMETLLAARAADTPVAAIAGGVLDAFVGLMNTSDGRGYLFGGINTAEPPLAAFGGTPAAALDAAFLARFGFAQDAPAVAAITAADMASFLDNEFAALFEEPAWSTDWSNASSQVARPRISPGETLSAAVSANEPATRKLAMVYTMVAALGTDGLGDAARAALLDKAVDVLADAAHGLTELRTAMGQARGRVERATERLEIQMALLRSELVDLDGVDPAETKVRIDTVSTQIEMSYALTGRLTRLSILNYV